MDGDKKKRGNGRYGKKGKMRCKLTQSLDSSCYDKYDENNMYEWKIALMSSWYNMGWLAVFGPFILMTSLFMIIAPIFMEEVVPDPDGVYPDMSKMDKMWVTWVAFCASMGAPTMFMLTQAFTWGESNLSDTSVLYMSEGETSLYFIFNTWWVLQHYPYALFHVTLFGCFYLFDLIMYAFKGIFGADAMGRWDDDDMDGDKWSKGKGKRDGDRKKDEDDIDEFL
jgi:hypothetical protein